MTRLSQMISVLIFFVCCLALLTEALDCRRFVFAPRCRGVSAKRSSSTKDGDLRKTHDFFDKDDWMYWQQADQDSSSVLPSNNQELITKQMLREIFKKYRDPGHLQGEDEDEEDK